MAYAIGGLSGDGGGPLHLKAMMRRRVWLVLLCVVLGGGLALILYYRQESTYRATAVIAIDDSLSQAQAPLGGSDPWRYSDSTDPVLSTPSALNSGWVLGRIVDLEGLRLKPLQGGGGSPSFLADVRVGEFALPDTVLFSFSVSEVAVESRRRGRTVRGLYGQRLDVGEISFRVPRQPGMHQVTLVLVERETALALLAENLTIRRRPGTSVVEVTFTASDAEVARRVVNRAATVFQEYSSVQTWAESQRRQAILHEKVTLADVALRAAQTEFAEFRIRERVMSSQAHGASGQSGLMSIEMRRAELEANRRMYRSILSGLVTAGPGEIGERLQAFVVTREAAESPAVSALLGLLMEQEAERQALTGGPQAAENRNRDLARITQQIATSRGRLEAAVRSHLDIVDARLMAVDQLRDRIAGEMAGQPETSSEGERLLQNVETIRRTVDQLRDESYRVRVPEAMEESPVQILELAGPPSPSPGTAPPVMMALGLMLGGLVGSGGFLVIDVLNSRVR